jgi:hypothetical protein
MQDNWSCDGGKAKSKTSERANIDWEILENRSVEEKGTKGSI